MGKKLSIFFKALALFVSHMGCIVVAYSYGKMKYMIKHEAYSVPVEVVFFYGIPFAIVFMLCLMLSHWWSKYDKI